MSKFFNIKTCPLCSRQLYVKYIDGSSVSYLCLETVSPIDDPNKKVTHYEVVMETSGTRSVHQNTIVPPYIMTTQAGTGRTKIYKWYPYLTVEVTGFIMEIPILLPDREPDKMAERIRNLIIFS